MCVLKYLTIYLLCLFITPTISADEKVSRDVTLLSEAGESIKIASVELTRLADDSYTYTINMDDSKFSNYFLAMRPFKCFKGAKQMLCHLPYPYKKNNKLSTSDLQDLEYDLLFIHRKATDYGIDPWNGLYYKLTLEKDAKLSGVLKVVDLDILAAPPDEGVTRPITNDQLNDADSGSHSYPKLLIQ